MDIYLGTPEKARPDVFDVLSCDYGCTVGLGVPAKHNKFEIAEIMENVKNDSFSRQTKQTVFSKNKQYKLFDSTLKLDDFLRSYTPKNPDVRPISENDVQRAYSELYKQTREEQCFDCQACGYSSCREMASAVAKGLNSPENCHQYIVKKNIEENLKIQRTNENILKANGDIHDLTAQLDSEIRLVSENTDRIVENSQENVSLIESVNGIVSGLQRLSDTMFENILQINSINEEYNSSSKLIEDIALQIKMLLLNASIETAHVGELGKGFAVVAGEVGSLADKTQAATKSFINSYTRVSEETGVVNGSINDIIAEIQNLSEILIKLRDSVESTGQTGMDMYGLIKSVTDVSEKMNRVMS